VPTVVVPDSWVPAAHTTGPVVVGLSISGAGQHDSPDAVVLREAFLRARALKVPLVAVYAWEVPALLTWSADDVSAVRGKVRRGLESLLTPWRSEFDDVEVVPDPVMGRPDDAIAQAAEEAQLIVLGRHTAAARHGGFHLGSTTRSLLHHTEVPVLVVPARGSCQERPDRAQVPTWAPMF
jgi:nucleotide-binding universal stress UspA family protein